MKKYASYQQDHLAARGFNPPKYRTVMCPSQNYEWSNPQVWIDHDVDFSFEDYHVQDLEPLHHKLNVIYCKF